LQSWAAAGRLFRYLCGTRDFGIQYKRGATADAALHGFSDADWAGDRSDRKSHSGHVFFWGGGPVVWYSRKQPCTSQSSTQAEYIAASEAAKTAMWLRNVFSELSWDCPSPIPIGEDNNAVVHIVENNDGMPRSLKHVELRYHLVLDLAREGKIVFKRVASENNVADLLTKALGPQAFERHKVRLVVRPANLKRAAV
jgi:hypothetical protein